MRSGLALLPGAFGLIMYLSAYSDLLGKKLDPPPNGWQWRLSAPLIAASLGPFVVAATRSDGSDVWMWFFVPLAVALLFLACLVGAMRTDHHYRSLFLDVAAFGKTWGMWKFYLLGVATIVLGFAALVTWSLARGAEL